MVQKNFTPSKNYILADDPVLRKILSRFKNVFQDELPSGLPMEGSIDHALEVEE